MTLKYISLIFSAIFEIYYANMFFKIFAKPKHQKNIHKIILLIVFIFQLINSLFNTQLLLLFVSIIITAILSLFYNGNKLINIVLSLLLTVLNAISEYITSGIAMIVLGGKYEEVFNNSVAYTLTVFTAKFITFFIILILRAFKTKLNDFSLSKRDGIFIFLLPLTTIFMMFFMCKMIFLSDDKTLNIMFVAASILMYSANIASIEILARQSKIAKNQIELEYLKENMQNQISHYQSIYDSQTEIRKIRHDLKNFYTAVLSLTRNGNIKDIESKISEQLNIVENNERVLNTNHPTIDAIIQSKIDICKKSDIKIDLQYFYKEQISINQIEVAVIIGNLLDNAIEACKKIDVQEKWINGIINVNDGEININICNSTNGKDKNLTTNKKDKLNHGLGIKSVNELAKKYNGQTSFSFGKNDFSAFVSLKNYTYEY